MNDLIYDEQVSDFHVLVLNLINNNQVEEAIRRIEELNSETRQINTIYRLARSRHFDLVNAADQARTLTLELAQKLETLPLMLDLLIELIRIRDLNLELTFALSHDLNRARDLDIDLDQSFDRVLDLADTLQIERDHSLIRGVLRVKRTIMVINVVLNRLIDEYPQVVTLDEMESLNPEKLSNQLGPFLQLLIDLQKIIADMKGDVFAPPVINSIDVGSPTQVRGTGWGDAVRVVNQVILPRKHENILRSSEPDMEQLIATMTGDVLDIYLPDANDTERRDYEDKLTMPLHALYESSLI